MKHSTSTRRAQRLEKGDEVFSTYKLTMLPYGDIYFGSTVMEPEQRLKFHLKSLIQGTHNNLMQSTFTRGRTKMFVETMATFGTMKEAEDYETQLIRQHPMSLNIEETTDDRKKAREERVYWDDETRAAIFEDADKLYRREIAFKHNVPFGSINRIIQTEMEKRGLTQMPVAPRRSTYQQNVGNGIRLSAEVRHHLATPAEIAAFKAKK